MAYFIAWMAIGFLYEQCCLRKNGRSWSALCDDISKSKIGDIIPPPILAMAMTFSILFSIAVWPLGLFARIFLGWDKNNNG